MATKICFSFSSSPFHRNTNAKLRLSQFVNRQSVAHLTIRDKDKTYQYVHGVPKLRGRLQKQQYAFVDVFEDRSQINGLQTAALVPKNHDSNAEDIFSISNPSFHLSGNDGKPGVVPFCNRPFSRNNEVILSNSGRILNSLLCFIGPGVLVASFIWPSFCFPGLFRRICGNSSSTFFLVLFLIEVISYCGVAFFLLLLDHLMRPIQLDPSANNSDTLTPQLGHRISSVATLVLSLAIPLISMGLAWPWTGPGVPGVFTPYLAGIVVQIKFEQQARYRKSPSRAAIPFIFSVYRLHQLYKAAHLLPHEIPTFCFCNYAVMPS
ncbi:uncharacterized protein LOC109797863 isoform X2 [Cajanus cajan]|uniref:uncharacterized protein LOC109797863 isoform X2 n=1 Tax=Cajanus cajan TaxID=3821 RepID=UPI0010FACF6A|nr:uncharacterized protein LOC109797863 isoform X2 [Cajanus cajan]